MTSTKFNSQPLFTRRQLTALLLPLIAEQALSVTIGLADSDGFLRRRGGCLGREPC